MLYFHFRRLALYGVLDLKELFWFKMEHAGYGIRRNRLHFVVIIAHVTVVEAPCPLYAVFSIRQLMLQFKEVLASL